MQKVNQERTGRKRRDALQTVIDNIQESGGENDDVFNSLLNEEVSYEKTKEKTDSTDLNVFASGDSRANSEEFFVTNSSTQRRLSLTPEVIAYNTRSISKKASMTRVPLEKTPLRRKNIRENDTPPTSPSSD